MNEFRLIVLSGGVSAEREVSLVSGRAAASALRESFPLQVVEVTLDSEDLPVELDPGRDVVFPVLHGGFGEDGGLQEKLEAAGFAYAGCDSRSSRLCMDKEAAKRCLESAGLSVPRGLAFPGGSPPDAGQAIAHLGSSLVLKPRAEGSSVGLVMVEGLESLREALASLGNASSSWLLEERVLGRELSVCVLEGRPQGVVESVPHGGVYDYRHKYTGGLTEYRCPAPLPPPATEAVRDAAARAFAACGCRDFARADFILRGEGVPCMLEINTLPGLTPTSLLPKSASVYGYSFPSLLRAMALPAIHRFHSRIPSHA